MEAYFALCMASQWPKYRQAAQHSTAQHGTAQHSTAQHSTAQHHAYTLSFLVFVAMDKKAE